MTTIKVNKKYETPKTGKDGKAFTIQSIYGTDQDNGNKWKASAFAPILNDVVEGGTYGFEITMNGEYRNVTKVIILEGDNNVSHVQGTPPAPTTSLPEQTPPPKTPIPVQIPPTPTVKSFTPDSKKQASIEKMHDEKTDGIRVSVALKSATDLVGNFIISDRDKEKRDCTSTATEVTEVADIFLDWLIDKANGGK